MMDTLVPLSPNNNRDVINTDAIHNGEIIPASNLAHHHTHVNPTENCNGNHLSDVSSDDLLVDSELDLVARLKQHRDVIKDVFMPVYTRHDRRSSEDPASRSPSTSPGESNLPPFTHFRNQPLGKPASKGPPRVLSYEEELQNRQQQLLDAIQLWKQKYKDKRTENVRLVACVQRVEEECSHVVERIAMEYQTAHDSLKIKLADIVCYADDVTQERNRVERELREGLEKAKERVNDLERRLAADKLETQRLRALTKRLEKERNNIIQEHNRLKQENDALWDKFKKNEPKLMSSPSVAELKAKYDTTTNSQALQKQCHILEMEREHYALLLDASLQRLQTYESGLATLLRAGVRGQVVRRNPDVTIVSQPGDPTKICIIDRKKSDTVSRFSDIEEERSDGKSAGSGHVDTNSDCLSRQSRSRPTSWSEDFSETDSLKCSPRFNRTDSLPSHARGSTSTDDSSSYSERTPPTPRSRSRGSVDTGLNMPMLKKSASSPGVKPKKNLTRSSSDHGAEREQKAPVSPTPSRSSVSDDKNTAATSSFGALRQRRGGVVNLPPPSMLVEAQSRSKKQLWGKDIFGKLKKKSSNPEKEDKNQSGHFWQRNKSRSVKLHGERGRGKPSNSSP